MNRHAQITDMKVSDAVRKLNPGVFGQDIVPKQFKTPNPLAGPFEDNPKAKIPQKPRLRQDRKGPNKLEAEFEAWLREEWKNKEACITPQGVNLWLANGVRYCPDFILAITRHRENDTPWIEVHAYETKGGFMRDDAAVKLKVAAHLHGWITFHLVTKIPKKKGGGWNIEKVLP